MTHYEQANQKLSTIKELYCIENMSITEISREFNLDRRAIQKVVEENELVQTTIEDKINNLKKTIEHLYCNEGRSKNYISQLLFLNRKKLTQRINDWGFIQGNSKRMKPSNQKFLNKNKLFIKSKMDSDVSLVDISKSLGVSEKYLSYIIARDEVLTKSSKDKNNRYFENARLKKEERENLRLATIQEKEITDFEGEVWKPILGFEAYSVSNFGRVKKYDSYLKSYRLMALQENVNSKRYFAHLHKDGVRKAFQVSRLVGHSFIDGFSETQNTIEHVDNDVQNNHYTNLRWVSQGINNKLAYEKGRRASIAYSSIGKFKYILLNDTYQFKTIGAFAKFIGKSTTQARRYINNEVTNNPYNIKIIR